jgi:hypothetical protein
MADELFAAPAPADVSFEDMLACVDRELAMRRKVYPRWVNDNKLTQKAADLEILKMRAVRRTLLCYEALCLTVADMGGPDTTIFEAALARLTAAHPEAT